MGFRKDVSWNQAFVLTESRLRGLDKTLHRLGEEIRYQAKCSDQGTRTFDDVDALAAYPNPSHGAVVDLFVSIRNDRPDLEGAMWLGSQRHHNVALHLGGDETRVLEVDAALKESLRNASPWYARFAAEGLMKSVLSLAGMLGLVSFGVWLWYVLGIADEPGEAWNGFAAGALVGAVAGALLFLVLVRVEERLFPAGVYAWGDGVGRHEHLEWIRRLVISILASLVIAAGGLWLAR